MIKIWLVFCALIGVFTPDERRSFTAGKFLRKWDNAVCWFASLLFATLKAVVVIGVAYGIQVLTDG